MELKLIESPADIYSLSEEDLAHLPGFKEKSIQNLKTSIDDSRSRPFSRVLFALGIRHVGERVAELLADHFKDIDNLLAASEEEISGVPGIGPEIAASIYSFFQDESNIRHIQRLREAGLQFRQEESRVHEGPLAGKTFVITGTLPTLSRNDATQLIESAGGKVTSSVSARTDYLLVGESPGSKLAKAEELGVPRITEQELRTMLGR